MTSPTFSPGGFTAVMGIKERRFDPLPPMVSLEDLVPRENFYRRLEAALDLSFVRDLARHLYARGGRPSIDPVVFFKLQLVMFFEGLRSERKLMRVAADRLSVRWYLGYDLHEPLPDHSCLTRTRERFGLAVFRRFFERIVEECAKAGLVRGDELFFDSTKVEANAAVDSLAPRWAVEAHLGELFDEGQGGLAPDQARPEARMPTAGDLALRETNAAKEDWISRDGAQDRSFKGTPWRQRTSDKRASRTDPDATPMTWAASGRRPGYQAHHVVDGGKARIVLNALVAPAEVTENRPMLDLLWRTWLRPHHVTADGKYGTLENVAALEEAGVRAYVALHESGSKPGFFAKGEFRYDPEADVYVCPAGKLLRPLGKKKDGEDRSDRVTFYRARAAECAVCPLKPRCTTNKNGRQLRRHPGEHQPRPGAILPRHGVLREGPAKTEGLGRAPVRRGQRLARDAEVPFENLTQGERRGAAGGGRPESQEVAPRRRPEAEETSPGGGPAPAGRRPARLPAFRATPFAWPRVREKPVLQQAGTFLGRVSCRLAARGQRGREGRATTWRTCCARRGATW
jgi:transposase